MEMEKEKLEERAHVTEAGVADNHVNTLHSEADLSEKDESAEDHHDHHDHHEDVHVDYTNYSKQQLAEVIRDLAKDDNFRRVDNVIREVKPLYDEMRERERAEALERFIAEGGTAED